jgi:hypothetical protein
MIGSGHKSLHINALKGRCHWGNVTNITLQDMDGGPTIPNEIACAT